MLLEEGYPNISPSMLNTQILQAELDELRNKLNAGREAIRERRLAQERAKHEAEQNALRAQQEQAAGGRTSKAGAKKGKKK